MVTFDKLETFARDNIELILIILSALVALCILSCLCKVIYPIITIPCKISKCVYKFCDCLCKCSKCCKKDKVMEKQEYYEPI